MGDKGGYISLSELSDFLTSKLSVSDEEVLETFHALDSDGDDKVHYSDFLAAMLSAQATVKEDTLRSAFGRFDQVGSGYITPTDLKDVIGDTYDGESVESLIFEA